MSYHHPAAQPWPASQASQSWGTASSLAANQSPPPSSLSRVAKSPVYPGSDASQYSWGLPSQLSWPPSSHTDAASSSWGSSEATLVSPVPARGVWPGPMPLSAPHAYGASSSSSMVSREHMPRVAGPHAAAGVQSHPLLQGGRLWCDFKYPPSMTPGTTNFNPQLSEIAFAPPLRQINVQFCDNPRWTLCIASPHALTIFAILGEIFGFLQQKDIYDAPQITPSRSDVRYQSRELNASPHSFHAGRRRIETLGRRRVFYDLYFTGSTQNTYTVRLCEPSQ
ncbi:hypothetical protein HYPSUDRAFT_216624 [Hypholoma sublateritium FD-334 SS-4]|uniref:DUF6699 domain-containing protein n=1 Tax=Hypholoma sublateritium (strain FD-334 SS-4) TaxID=945553 RepID=A0A0D2NQ86_HYPSF|nr:hypothetical protein HYPSUDRAFT_216624 [Hypholoma sublateritium FD-334 SS-4]